MTPLSWAVRALALAAAVVLFTPPCVAQALCELLALSLAAVFYAPEHTVLLGPLHTRGTGGPVKAVEPREAALAAARDATTSRTPKKFSERLSPGPCAGVLTPAAPTDLADALDRATPPRRPSRIAAGALSPEMASAFATSPVPLAALAAEARSPSDAAPTPVGGEEAGPREHVDANVSFSLVPEGDGVASRRRVVPNGTPAPRPQRAPQRLAR